MRKFLKFAFVGAIALTGFGFTSCSSDEDFDETTNLTGEAVKTQFTISFPQNVAKIKQSAATVQSAENLGSFRGMDKIVLVPFVAEGAAGTDPIASTATPLGKNIVLTNMIKPSEINNANNSIPANTLTATSNSVLFNDVDIPLGTGSFLFYGKAIDNTANTAITTPADKFKFGTLTATITESTAPSNYSFAPVAIFDNSESNVGKALAEYVTAIAQATGWSTATNTAIKNLYDKFITMKTGSSRDIQAAVQDLYQSLYKNTDAVSTAVCTKILTKATDDGVTGGGDANGNLTFNATLGEVKANIADETNTYPLDVNIPDGAALLSWSTTDPKVATQKIDGNTWTLSNVTGKFADYVYPASLYYYANSGVKTANASKKDKYNTTNTWANILNEYTDGTAVAVSTRSVAIIDQIQYAVGRLDTKVTAEAATLYDKKGEAVTGTDASRFPITGILIGGQKPVNFAFHQATGTEVTIYDNIVKSQSSAIYATTTTPTDPQNYTLALETAKDQPVFVAVEFLNNSGQDFEGLDGIVPTGGKFYLIAQLTPSAGTGYDADDMNQIFKQDYKTVVNFTIKTGYAKDDTVSGHFNPATGNTEGLGKAYNTIPDLRTPKLELGLSVNLEWIAGLTFNVNL